MVHGDAVGSETDQGGLMEAFLWCLAWASLAALTLWLLARDERQLTVADLTLSILFAPWALLLVIGPKFAGLLIDGLVEFNQAWHAVVWRSKK